MHFFGFFHFFGYFSEFLDLMCYTWLESYRGEVSYGKILKIIWSDNLACRILSTLAVNSSHQLTYAAMSVARPSSTTCQARQLCPTLSSFLVATFPWLHFASYFLIFGSYFRCTTSLQLVNLNLKKLHSGCVWQSWVEYLYGVWGLPTFLSLPLYCSTLHLAQIP